MRVEETTRRNLEAQVSIASPHFFWLTVVRSNFLVHFSKVDEKYRKKLEQTNDNEKTQRRAAEMAGVATELVLVIDDQKKAVEKELEVRWWVWAPD
jgi:hypothetical protein